MRRIIIGVFAVLALAGCTKPSPGITVVSGTASTHQMAICWTFDKDSLEPGMCAQEVVSDFISGERVARIPVSPGQTVGISVDPVVADVGWTPVIGNQPLVSQPINALYYRFAYPELQEVPDIGLDLQIIAGSAEQTKGLWAFKLVRAN
jgi:hypothetical protein